MTMTSECIGLDLSTRPLIASVDAEVDDEQRVEERRKCSYLIDDLLRTDHHSNHHRNNFHHHHASGQKDHTHNGNSDLNEYSQNSIDQLRTGQLHFLDPSLVGWRQVYYRKRNLIN